MKSDVRQVGRRGHLRRYPQADGAGHQYVVVTSVASGVSSRRVALVYGKLVAGLSVSLDVGAVAHEAYQMAYDQGLGLTVGVKSDTVLKGVSGRVECPPAVEVGVMAVEFRQQYEGIIGVGSSLAFK